MTERGELYQRYYKYGKIPQLSNFACAVNQTARQHDLLELGVAGEKLCTGKMYA